MRFHCIMTNLKAMSVSVVATGRCTLIWLNEVDFNLRNKQIILLFKMTNIHVHIT